MNIHKKLLFACLIALMGFAAVGHTIGGQPAFAQWGGGDYSPIDPTGSLTPSGPAPSGTNPYVATQTTDTTERSTVSCAQLRATNGVNSGGTSGFFASGQSCFSGGGNSYCVDGSEFEVTRECAAVNVIAETDIDWPDFEPPDDMSDAEKLEYYTITTRDDERGRAGHTHSLFMNAHGICREIDNTAANEPPVFVAVKTAEEWRTVHGVPSGGDANGGHDRFADYSNSDFPVPMYTCCSPQIVEICGVQVSTGYTRLGNITYVFGAGGYSELQCVGNNEYAVVNVLGICGGCCDDGGGGEGMAGGSSGGYANPDNGGTVSQADYDAMSPEAQDALGDMGYGPADVDSTNAQGQADVAAAEAAAAEAEAEAEAEAAEAEAAMEAAEAEAEAQAEADAAEAAESDSDDGGDDE